MADSDFTVKAIISAQTSQFEKGVKKANSAAKDFGTQATKSIDNVKKSVDSLSAAFGAVAKAAAAAFAVNKIVKFGAESVKAADSANKSLSILSNTIQATGASAWTTTDELVSLSNKLSETTNYSVGEIQDMQSVMLGFWSVTDDVFDEANKAVLDMATVMGMDLTSAAQTVGKALDDPINGLGSLSRQGFVFSNAEKEMLTQLVAVGEKAKAQQIILDTLNKTYGGAAEAGMSAFAQMNNSMTALKETLGNELMPVITEITKNTNEAVKKITSYIQKIGLAEKLAYAYSLITTIFDKIQTAISPFIQKIVEKINEIKDIFSELIGGFDLSGFEETFGLIVGIAERVIQRVEDKFNRIKAVFLTVKDEVAGIFENIDFSAVQDYVNTIIAAGLYIYDRIYEIVQGLYNSIADFVLKVWNKIKEIFANSNNALQNSETDIKSWKDFFYTQLDTVFRYFQDLVGMVSNLLKGNWAAALEYAKLAMLRMANVVLDTISTILNAFPKMTSGITTAINTMIKGINKVREWLNLNPIELIDIQAGNIDIAESLGLDDAISEAEAKIEELTKKTADVSIIALNEIKDNAKKTGNSVLGEISDTTVEIQKDAQNRADYIIEQSNRTKDTVTANNTEEEESSEKTAKTIWEQWSEYWKNQKKELAENAEDWTGVFDSVKSTIGDVGTELVEDLGAALVEGGDAFEDFGDVAVEAIAKVLEALAAQLAALAAVKVLSYQYGQAAMAAAAAATALAAAGAMKAVAKATSEAGDEAISTAAKIKKVQEAIEELLETGATSSLTVAEQFAKVQTTIADAESALATAKAEYESALKYLQSFSAQWYNTASYQKAVKAYESASKNYDSALKAQSAATNAYNTLIGQTVTALQSEYTATQSMIDAMKKLYTTAKTTASWFGKTFTTSSYKLILQEQINGIQEILEDAYSDIVSLGNEIGEAFIDSLMDGLDADGFASSLGDYVKKLVLKMALLTDDFMNKLGEKATDLAQAVVSLNVGSISSATSALKELYSEYESQWTVISDIIDNIFAKTEDTIDDSTSLVEESLTTLESAIKSYKEEIADLGASIASELISSMSSSLSLDEALVSFKSFLRNYVIQMYVYSASWKSRIQKIGELISDALENGITKEKINSIRNLYAGAYGTLQYYMTSIDNMLNTVMPDIQETVEDTTEEIEETLTAFEKAMESFKDSISDLGGDIASEFISSLSKSYDVDEALVSFKSFIRDYVIQAYVYTNTMKSKIESIGDLISKAINGGSLSKSNVTTIANQVKKVYTELAKSMETVDKVLDAVMPDIEDTVEDTTEEIEETLTAFESAIKSFKDTIADLGGDIASELISGLTNGLDSSDFLDSFKTYLKKLIIQSVVYTETLQSEIESIGTMIADGLSNGFSETTLHEIRRDISYLFSSANTAISGIDTLLESVFSGYATGTQSAISGLHLVGEAGPELVNFKGGERVYNNTDTMKILSGSGDKGNTFNVTFNNLRDTSAYAMMSQLRDYNRQMAINGIL